MMDATVHRIFEVEAPLDDAWHGLADVKRWPEWAPHIRSVRPSPSGELGPTSSGEVHIKGLGRNRFRVSEWEPPVRWEWVSRFPGLRVYYDHRFKETGSTSTQMEWLVTLRGPISPLIRRAFARIYGRNVDRAIPRLQEWFRAHDRSDR
jgi:Polyketide cyclase / dehydrase and lipid transport